MRGKLSANKHGRYIYVNLPEGTEVLILEASKVKEMSAGGDSKFNDFYQGDGVVVSVGVQPGKEARVYVVVEE